MLMRHQLAAAAAVPVLLLSLVACAPEPGDTVPDDIAGAPEKGAEIDGGGDWGETSDPNDPALKSAELPEGFPSDAFVLPESAVIDDAGNRDGVWFVVLRAADEGQADAWWAEVPSASELTVGDEQVGPDSVSADLIGTTISVTALRVAQPDGSILLTYDIVPQVL